MSYDLRTRPGSAPFTMQSWPFGGFSCMDCEEVGEARLDFVCCGAYCFLCSEGCAIRAVQAHDCKNVREAGSSRVYMDGQFIGTAHDIVFG